MSRSPSRAGRLERSALPTDQATPSRGPRPATAPLSRRTRRPRERAWSAGVPQPPVSPGLVHPPPGLPWPGSPWPIRSARPPVEPTCQRVRPGYACGPWPGTPLPSPPQGTIDLPGSIPSRQVMTLVVGPLAAGQSQLDLGLPVLEVQRQRDQSQAALSGRRSQLVDLLAVHKQLTGSARIMVGPGALRVLRNVHVVQPNLVVADLAEPVGERRPSRAQRLHLGAGEHQPRFVGVLDGVVVPGSPVPGDDLRALLGSHIPSLGITRADNAGG